MTNQTKNCIDCGKSFVSSRTGYTVRCQDCRGRKVTVKKSSYSSITCCKCGTEFSSLRCPKCGY